jgi:hypothetical protein
MTTAEPTLSALNYHQRQARFSNLIVLAFLGVLVVFTLYRVVAEWTLAQQYKSVAEYRESMDKAQALDRERLQKVAELNFIAGKDANGANLSVKTLAGRGSSRRPASISAAAAWPFPTSERAVPALEAADLHRRYSPFYRDCSVVSSGGKARLQMSDPDEFVSQALAALADKLLAESPDRALDFLCVENPLGRRGDPIPVADEALLPQFAALLRALPTVRANSGSVPTTVCAARKTVVEKLVEILSRDWYPDSPAEPAEYLNPSTCEFSRKFDVDSASLLAKASSLDVKPAERLSSPDALFTIVELAELKDAISASDLRMEMQKLRSQRSEKEVEKTKELKSQIDKLQSDIDKLRQLKPLSVDASESKDRFSLHQFLLSALFVISALTAAVTSSYMARAHSSEVVEIERHLRGAPNGYKAEKNPFSREPKSTVDLAPIKELLAMLKGDESPRRSTSATGKVNHTAGQGASTPGAA